MEKNIKLNETVLINRSHKKYDWNNTRHCGVIMSIEPEKFTIKNQSGNIETIKTNEEDYDLSIVPMSEINFIDEIEKSIKNLEEESRKMLLRIDEVKKWEEKYRKEVSLVGRLVEFLSYHVNKNI